MIDSVEILPKGPIAASIRPPGSKSITNRALVCAALAEGKSVLVGASDCDDARAMCEALGRLDAVVEHDANTATVRVTGNGGELPAGDVELYAAGSGATARFLAAVAALGRGTYRIDGSSRMRRRPMKDLLNALDQFGVDVAAETGNECLPVTVHGRGLRGGRATIAGDVSSQFLSGLLMAAPYAARDVELEVVGPLVSRPFVDMTKGVMGSFGVVAEEPEPGRFAVAAGQRYRPQRYEIEPDATAAGYFLAAAAVTRGTATVKGLTHDSIQGDMEFCECLRRMGCDVRYGPDGVTVVGRQLRGIEIDMGRFSDAVPTLAAAALFASGQTTIRGVAHVRRKESDRIGDLAAELRKFGADVVEREDGLTIAPGPLRGAQIDPHDDHRLAMALSLVGLAVPGVIVRNPGCVRKTYPDFFRDLEEI
ncbi:MAG: 3-phosphoshikimate 1-carboxyvinyltransferase [Pirellulales bacterium]|nr:3-phosphoshikimate 1-carboxyvinyltransferase [Pirellulales bacterium]